MGFYKFIRGKELFPAEGQKGVVICPLDAQVRILAGHWSAPQPTGTGREGRKRVWVKKTGARGEGINSLANTLNICL